MQPRVDASPRARCQIGVIRRSVWMMTVLLLSLPLVSCTNRETPVDAQSRIGSAPAGTPIVNVTLGELLDEPGQYAGKTVTVSGEVNDVLGPKAFTIGGEEFLPPGELLVVSRNGFPTIPDREANEYLVDDDIVQVTGNVRTFVRAEVSRDMDADDMQGETYVEWEGRPVLVVSNMVTTPRARANRSGEGASTAPITDVVVVVTAPDREALVGRQVQITGVKVQSVPSDKGFWIGPSDHQRLFVRLDEVRTPGTPVEGRVDIDSGQTVSVTGTLRRLPAQDTIRSNWGLDTNEAAALMNERVYLHAERAQVLER